MQARRGPGADGDGHSLLTRYAHQPATHEVTQLVKSLVRFHGKGAGRIEVVDWVAVSVGVTARSISLLLELRLQEAPAWIFTAVTARPLDHRLVVLIMVACSSARPGCDCRVAGAGFHAPGRGSFRGCRVVGLGVRSVRVLP